MIIILYSLVELIIFFSPLHFIIIVHKAEDGEQLYKLFEDLTLSAYQIPDDKGFYYAYLIYQLQQKLPKPRRNPPRGQRYRVHQECRTQRIPGLKVKEWHVVECMGIYPLVMTDWGEKHNMSLESLFNMKIPGDAVQQSVLFGQGGWSKLIASDIWWPFFNNYMEDRPKYDFKYCCDTCFCPFVRRAGVAAAE